MDGRKASVRAILKKSGVSFRTAFKFTERFIRYRIYEYNELLFLSKFDVAREEVQKLRAAQFYEDITVGAKGIVILGRFTRLK